LGADLGAGYRFSGFGDVAILNAALRIGKPLELPQLLYVDESAFAFATRRGGCVGV
jgi:hypothetical protein